MSRRAKWLIIVAFFIVFIGLFLLQYTSFLCPPSLGTGSIRHARKWKEKLVACNSLDDVRKKFNCGRYRANSGGSYTYIRDPNTYREGNTWALLYDLPNGDWLAMAYANSHNTWGGGTVVTRDNTGRIRVFFGHVCGTPSAFGESLEEVYACFGDRYWKEVSSAE